MVYDNSVDTTGAES